MRGRGLPFDSMGRRAARASPHSARGERMGRRDGCAVCTPPHSARGERMGRRDGCAIRAPPHSARGERMGRMRTASCSRTDGEKGWVCGRARPIPLGANGWGEGTGMRDARRHIPLGANGWGEGMGARGRAPPHSARGERMGRRDGARYVRAGRRCPVHSARGERMGRRDGYARYGAPPHSARGERMGRRDGYARAPPHSARGERMGARYRTPARGEDGEKGRVRGRRCHRRAHGLAVQRCPYSPAIQHHRRAVGTVVGLAYLTCQLVRPVDSRLRGNDGGRRLV